MHHAQRENKKTIYGIVLKSRAQIEKSNNGRGWNDVKKKKYFRNGRCDRRNEYRSKRTIK